MKKETEFAVNLAKKSGKFLLSSRGKIKYVKEKGPKNYFTDVDIKSEEIIVGSIQRKFHDHNIISEELGEVKGRSNYRWLIDPLDGTHNFIHGFPLFGVSIALEYKGEIVLGVINIPTLNQIFIVEKDKGAYLNNRKIHVSNASTLKESMITFDSAFYLRKKKILRIFSKLIDNVFRVRLPGTAVFELSAIAQGITSAHIGFFTNSWDVSAGFLLIREAGGNITDHQGRNVDHYCREFVATNGIIHQEILECIGNIR